MAKSTCSTSSNSSYSSAQSAASTSSSRSSQHSTSGSSLSSTSHLGFKSMTDRRKRLAANARERKRMHLLNQAYDRLRKRLVDAENKSKYDVLVQAKEYIQALAAICEKMDTKETAPSTSGDNPTSPMRPESTNSISSSPATATIATTNLTTYVTPADTIPLIVPSHHHHHHNQKFDSHSQHQYLQHHHQQHHHHAITRYDHTLDYV